MQIKEEIIAEFNAGIKQADLGRKYNLSRARIGQIVHGYKTIKIKKLKYHVFIRDKNQCTLKEKCKGQKLELNIHHLDQNSKNNNIDNLITLCDKCHAFVHSLLHEKELKKYTCLNCKNTFNRFEGTVSIETCNNCIREKKEFQKQFWAKNLKLYSCVQCGRSNTKHNGKGLCLLCYSKNRYKDPIFKKKHSLLVKKWQQEHPEKVKKWGSKNKDKINNYRRKSYYKNHAKSLIRNHENYEKRKEKARTFKASDQLLQQ